MPTDMRRTFLLLALTLTAATAASSVCSASPVTRCVDEVEANCTTADLRGADFSGRNLPESNFETSRLDGARFVATDLRRANFHAAVMPEADLSRATLDGATFFAALLSRANLEGVSAKGVNLTRANLEGARLKGADLAGAILLGTRLGGAVWVDGRVCAADSIGACR